MINRLEVFTYGQLQDTINVLGIMKEESLTIDDLRRYIKDNPYTGPKTRYGFLKRHTKAQREAMQAQRGMQRQPCKRCDEKRRGKK